MVTWRALWIPFPKAVWSVSRLQGIQRERDGRVVEKEVCHVGQSEGLCERFQDGLGVTQVPRPERHQHTP